MTAASASASASASATDSAAATSASASASVSASDSASASANIISSSRRSKFMTIVAVVSCFMVGTTVTYTSFGATNNSNTVVYKTAQQDQRNTATADLHPATSSSTSTTTTTTSSRKKMSGWERLLQSEPEPDANDVNALSKEDALVAKIAEKLKPVSLRFIGDDDENEDGEVDGEVETITTNKKKGKGAHQKQTLLPHQFLHLHHMKTGGTSIDELLRCSIRRLKKEANYEVPYYSIHECSRGRFATCLTDNTNACRASMDTAAVMSYCAALKYLDEFGWWKNNIDEDKDKNEDDEDEHEDNPNNERQVHQDDVNNQGVKAFTVLRHPVDRVWSMFRFQTKNCYQCTPLKDIYQKLEKGEDTGLSKLCLDQLQNHETNNLLSTEWPLEVTELIANQKQLSDDEEDDNLIDDLEESRDQMVKEAIDNMKGFFTVIGITEELVETAKILGTVFPWMHLEGNDVDGTSSTCPLAHANASPKNNRCGEGGNTHWELPKQPDQETYDLIVKYNSLDMELYEAAVSYFVLQKRALGVLGLGLAIDVATETTETAVETVEDDGGDDSDSDAESVSDSDSDSDSDAESGSDSDSDGEE